MRRLLLIVLTPVLLIAWAIVPLAYALLVAISPPHAWRVAVAIDQAVNASTKGDEDETISSRAGKGARRGVWHWCLLCRVLDWLDPGHCEREIEPDEGKPAPEIRAR